MSTFFRGEFPHGRNGFKAVLTGRVGGVPDDLDREGAATPGSWVMKSAVPGE
jgi:hypothetical protein